ncbi:MAG: ABC transporter substrate-binding protein [Paludibacteraceae bacterium]|nr:ABC transporter substrate-binding protein [Paludibacteraceae bacterium]MBQ2190643.1 ABC transporter substrate-binding protein [Paludibacteraceae bacterium]MBQ4018057.1 ABC transporter substrate-binding protein [Paludibacteraceae bacterium]
MKKVLVSVLALVAIVLTSCGGTDRAHQLKVLNWADYIDEDVKAGFEQWYFEQTGEKVELVYEMFDINETALTKIEVGHEDYDVFCPSEYIIERMLKKDLLIPIQKDLIADSIYYFDNISPFVTAKFQQMAPSEDVKVSDYTVGYMWGTTGFIYNPQFVEREELTSWAAILNPKFENRILMKDAFRDVYSVLVLYAYAAQIEAGDVNRDELVRNITPERVEAVKQILLQAKKQISGWEVDFGKEEMTKGKTWLNLSWSGDAQFAIEEAAEMDVMLDYIVPQEGSNVWFDGWVIPKYAKNIKAATYFIDYMCRADNALANMTEIGYVSCAGGENAAPIILADQNDAEEWPETVDASYFFGEEPIEVDGEQLDPHALHLNPVYYADKSIIDRCALMHDAGDAQEMLLEMWNEIKLAR